MIKKSFTPMILLVVMVVGCSNSYLRKPFSYFGDATGEIGKNTVYIFEQLQEEEIKLRIAEATGKGTIAPTDLEPQVLTAAHLELRKELVQYIGNYANLLESLIDPGSNQEILDNAKRIKDNLENISRSRDNFITETEIGIISTLAVALPQAVTASSSRKFLLNLMKRHETLLDRVTGLLLEELVITREMINNFLDRRFRLTTEQVWPQEETRRGEFARSGADILERKRELNNLLQELEAAMAKISPTHRRLLEFVESKKNVLNVILSLVADATRLEQLYMELSMQKL